MTRVAKSLKEYIEIVDSIKSKEWLYNPVYRGQGNADWRVESTLERAGFPSMSFEDYYTRIDYFKPEINAMGHSFERKIIPLKGKYDFDFSDYYKISFNQFPELEYLTYLRHHGFPTPLIDVTKSEFVALFFACENAYENGGEKSSKVFVFNRAIRAGGTGCVEVHDIGHYIETDKRHIAQQSEYILSAQFSNMKWSFVPFESAKLQKESFLEDDASKTDVFEIEIDGGAKKQILADLDRMNINHFSMYLDEDSLVRKLKNDFIREPK